MRHLLAAAAAAAAASTCLAAPLIISATPAAPTAATVNFTVAWTGVPSPQSTDWVASYCVGAAETSFGPWAYTSVAPTWATGAGVMSLVVEYDAGSCSTLEIRMYRDPSPYTYLNASNAIHWSGGGGGTAPRHVRISYGAVPQSQLTVSWTSSDATTPAVLLLGTAPGRYDLPPVTAAAGITYAAEDSCGPPSGWAHPGYFHHALVTGLAPATRYFYVPTQNGTRGNESSFVSGKARGAAVPTRFAVYADMYISGGSGAVDTAAHLTARVTGANDLDFLLHVGDLAYGLGSVGVWNTFHSLIEPYAARIPYLVSIGNHEYDYSAGQDGSKDPSGAGKMYSPTWWNGGTDSGGECGMPTARRFRTPANGNGVFWYSFAVGNVHVAMISSEHDPNPGAPMGDW